MVNPASVSSLPSLKVAPQKPPDVESTDKKISVLSNIIIGAWAIIATAIGFLTLNPLVAVFVFGVGSAVTLGLELLIEKIYEKIMDTCFPPN